MISTVLNAVFLFLTSRPLLILIAGTIFISSLPMIHEQWKFITAFWDIRPNAQEIEEIDDLIDGLAGILVAAGVFFEERETIRNLALRKHGETNHTQSYLNEVAHHNGMGMLLIGLFMEIGTLLIRIPNRVLDTQNMEKYIFAACLMLSCVNLLILFDFLKDYIKTFILREYRTQKASAVE